MSIKVHKATLHECQQSVFYAARDSKGRLRDARWQKTSWEDLFRIKNSVSQEITS